MRRALRRLGLVSLVTIGLVVAAVSNAEAQGRTMGKVTDEWDNGLEGATVLAEPEGTGSGGPQTTTADDKGEFMFIGLARGNWSFTATIEGYQGVRLVSPISQLSANRPIEFELPALASGGRFRDRTEFEAEGGTAKAKGPTAWSNRAPSWWCAITMAPTTSSTSRRP